MPGWAGLGHLRSAEPRCDCSHPGSATGRHCPRRQFRELVTRAGAAGWVWVLPRLWGWRLNFHSHSLQEGFSDQLRWRKQRQIKFWVNLGQKVLAANRRGSEGGMNLGIQTRAWHSTLSAPPLSQAHTDAQMPRTTPAHAPQPRGFYTGLWVQTEPVLGGASFFTPHKYHSPDRLLA